MEHTQVPHAHAARRRARWLLAILICATALLGAYRLYSRRTSSYGLEPLALERLGSIDPDLAHEPDPATHVKDLERRVARDPEAALVLAELGRAYFAQGVARHNPALVDLAEERAKSSLAVVSFRNAAALEVLAHVASHKHQFESAITLSRQLIEGGQTQGFEVLISALLAQGQVAEALVSATDFIRVDPGFSSFLNMGLAREATGDMDAAERYYIAAIKADPQTSRTASLWSRSILARFYIRLGRLEEGSIVLRQVLRFDSQYAFGIGLEGELLLALEDYLAAAESFQRAFVISRDPIYLYHAANAYKRGGDSRSWRDSLDAAILLYQKAELNGGAVHKETLDKALRERSTVP
jgi:tetratricopeptide (TPR) repeat protein